MSDPEPLSLFEQPEATIPERGMEKPIKPAVRMIAPPTPTAHTGPVVITPIDEAPLRAQDSLWVATPPPYVRPTMTEALGAEPTGLKAVGSFSGCGGSSLGLRMAGIEVKYAIEFIPAAADVYEANLPGTHVDRRDIRLIKPEEILEQIGMARGELDIFEGSPPCASFTPAGKRTKLWGTEKKYSDSRQRTDDLFWEWARVLDGLHPRAFIAENVPGMLMARALDEYAYKVVNELSALGYKVWTNVLNAASYGVPQQRRRLIFVGLRRDLGLEWEWPVPTTPVAHTFRQLMAAVPPDDPDHGPFLSDCSFVGTTNEARWNHLREARRRKAAGGQAGMYGGWTEDDVVRCQRCGEFLTQHTVTRRAKGGIAKEATCRDGGDALFPKNGFQFILPDPDEPCPTVIADGWGASGGSLAHPQEPRKLTPAELKSASGFPRDFILSGKLKQRYERIGRAVPPPLYAVVGRQLVHALKSVA